MKINTLAELRELYAQPAERPLKKVLSRLDKHCIHFISKSPFAVISTINKGGNMDASPRGGVPGFIKVINSNTIIIPDSKGNNRLDSLENIIETGRIGMLFLIPGIDETLRLNGSAILSKETALLNLFKDENRPPKVVISISIEEVFLHCAKALMRSKLWKPETFNDPSIFPSIGQMLKDQIGGSETVESRKDMIERYQKDL